MIRSAIDIGSNSVRLLIGEVADDKVLALEQHLYTTRLGRTKKGEKLDALAVEKTISALKKFESIINKYVAAKPIVVATSAVREAADKADFSDLIYRELGWELKILSGEEEAKLSFKGATSIVRENAAVIDVGGGSTELIIDLDGKIIGKSVAVGAVRLNLGEIKRENLRSELLPLKANYVSMESKIIFVGVGGTITSLAAMKKKLNNYDRNKVNGCIITKFDLLTYYDELKKMTAEETIKKYPLLKNREDIICDGIEVYLALADLLGFKEITVSDAGILDGLLLQKI